MRNAVVVWAVAGALGCRGPHQDGVTTTPGPGGGSGSPAELNRATSAAVFGSGTPQVTVGERMTFRLSLRGLELAMFEIGVGDLQVVSGQQTVLVQSHAQSTGIADMVASVDDHFSSWLDVTTGRSVRFQVDELSTQNKRDLEHVVVDFAARKGDQVPIWFNVNADPATSDTQTVSAADIWDFNSFLVALRAWEPKAGATLTVEAMRSRWMWRITATAVGRENLVTELGEIPALKFDMHSTKLGRDGQRAPNNGDREFTIYISDDADRVPLLVSAATDYGDVKLAITEYQPGTGAKLHGN